jgi:hypothetical protein
MTIKFPKGCLQVDRTFNFLAALFGAEANTVTVVGSCVVDGELLEFGVTFMDGQTTLVSAPGRSYGARSIKVKAASADRTLIRAAKMAVKEMLESEMKHFGRVLGPTKATE